MALPLGLLAAGELLLVPSTLRTVFRGALSLAVFTAMALWVRLNRAALDTREWCDCAAEKTTVRVIPSRRQPERLGMAPASDERNVPLPGWIVEEDEAGAIPGRR